MQIDHRWLSPLSRSNTIATQLTSPQLIEAQAALEKWKATVARLAKTLSKCEKQVAEAQERADAALQQAPDNNNLQSAQRRARRCHHLSNKTRTF